MTEDTENAVRKARKTDRIELSLGQIGSILSCEIPSRILPELRGHFEYDYGHPRKHE
jgi:hypothetical protein